MWGLLPSYGLLLTYSGMQLSNQSNFPSLIQLQYSPKVREKMFPYGGLCDSPHPAGTAASVLYRIGPQDSLGQVTIIQDTHIQYQINIMGRGQNKSVSHF